MGIKIIGGCLYALAVLSLGYAVVFGDYRYVGVGLSVAWLTILLSVVYLSISTLINLFGNDTQRNRLKESAPANSKASLALYLIKSTTLFLLMGATGFYFTASVYAITCVIFKATTHKS